MLKNKKTWITLAFSALLMVGCGGPSSNADSAVGKGEFDYEDPGTILIPPDSHGGVTPPPASVDDGRVDNFGDLNIEVIATVDKDGKFVAEAEDCDTSGCTLQTGCAGFFESTGFASGGMCIACISSPSILAFSFELKGDCTIEFQTVSAKYENPWDLDANVSYFVDKVNEDQFAYSLSSKGYSDFGQDTATGNQWYNFKTVSLGSLELKAGTHTMYIKVNGAFPNTDCFNLVATNYQAK